MNDSSAFEQGGRTKRLQRRDYVVLEGYVDIKKDTLKVGDMIEVIDVLQSYTMLKSWFIDTKNNIFENHYVYRKLPDKSNKYKVVAIGNHTHFIDTPIYCIQNLNTTQVFLIGQYGIRKA